MPTKQRTRAAKPWFILALICIWVSGCKGDRTQSMDKTPIAFEKEGELSLLQQETDSTLVTLDIEIADSSYEIQTGMMYRKDMGDREGMLFIFEAEEPHSFYMKNTLVALDILFVDSDLNIVRIHKNAVPLDETGIPSGGPVQFVLEVRAGMTDRWGVREGDRIEFQKMR